MKITIAKTAGFCMGVRRAVDMVLDAANSTNDPICTYGPLIHNPQVLKMLEDKGIPAISRIPETAKGTVLIRAHGVPPESQHELEQAGFKVINATCPRVIRVQTIIRKHAEKGYATIIIGDRDHPEVKGLMGYSAGKGHTVCSMEELADLPCFEKAVIVAQTTQDTSLYDDVKKWATINHPHYKLFDTICDSTEKRQAEVRQIARTHDAVVVVGGKESGNTKRLAQIASETGKFYVHIEDISELEKSHLQQLGSAESIAITAGASTPNWIINKTFRSLETELDKKDRAISSSLIVMSRQIRNFLLRTNLLLAAGAGSMTYACSKLQNMEHILIHSFIAMLYVLSMQIMNNLFSISSDRYNNPERADFYERHKKSLSATAFLAGATGIYLSFSTAMLPFIILSVMSMLGLLYNQKLFSASFRGRKISRIKDIPGSKTFLIAVAWGSVTSLLPALSRPDPDVVSFAFVVPFVFTTALLFARTAFFALLEIQGDRITGKETLPIILGEKRTKKLIHNSLYIAALIIFISTLTGIIPKTGLLTALIPLSMIYLVKLHEKGALYPGMHLEFIMESHFLLSGFLVLFT
ncbi:IspH [Desulfamplus magnetovallimortis]|uniref:4-hydroxy-3-methylbut-2-enyl diphosphate reductase n=1 Tax=Desulfamplus magnetovallimortis TaxID=1246637 RepID=A0A1W1HH09_9BACT|nr:4-hydroxy-3-methylbut-2-enyl diphosphate reductase [Desulfamplus magnetovallimortis]SLM31668.1 IspH [Desulfamplus magnetovallimortis]